MSYLPKFSSLPDPTDRFNLCEIIGIGIYAKVYRAVDNQEGGRNVAIKVQSYDDETKENIQEEYKVLRDNSPHPNLPTFHGVYLNKAEGNIEEIWFVLEFCEGGSVTDLVNGLHKANRRFNEEHIAYILKETTKALLHLHKNHIIHRDIKGDNVLLTKEGEVKLCDFGLARSIDSSMGKRSTCIGSPCWMAPEVVSSPNEGEVYGSRIDVWALGILAIELGDGRPPFADMHPTRVMFQIVRNPPPTLYRPAVWSQNFNDFIAECLEKNFEHRPFLIELVEHPFLTELPDNDYFLSQELKSFIGDMKFPKEVKKPEIAVCKGFIQQIGEKPEQMCVEDLAALEKLTEETIINELQLRMEKGNFYTFVGDVLLSLNSNSLPDEFPRSTHNKYISKSRSDNAPHIFAVADSAYQAMLHHEEPQYIVLSGESFSGKTTNFRHLLKHLIFIGEGNKGIPTRIESATNVIQALVNAGTPVNPDATKCFFQAEITFGSTGKLSGAVFSVNLVEKLRVSSTDMNQSSYHIFYYFYYAMVSREKLNDFYLEPDRKYRYLRTPAEKPNSKLNFIRDDPEGNTKKFEQFEEQLLALDFYPENITVINNILAAILILGDVRFKEEDSSTKVAEIDNPDVAQKVANLLKIDDKKFQWALVNYCVVEKGCAERRKHTPNEARDARDVLAGTLYCRLVDWITNTINQKLTLGRAVFGDIHSITLIDMFGFECFPRNNFEQLIINSLNEQMQYHYNQRMFVWEMVEHEEEQVPATPLHFYDNKPTVDQLMSKPKGLFYLLDDATKGRHGFEYLTDSISRAKNDHLTRTSSHEFSLAHYTGKVTYDVRDLGDKNRDFLPPEMVESLRTSTDDIVKLLFTNKLSKTGNLTMTNEENIKCRHNRKGKWGAALLAERGRTKPLNTLSHGEYSQIHKMRTLSSVFRATCLEILKGLSIGANSGGTHFVRCIRADLDHKPRGFQPELVRQQIKAMSVLDTAKAKQKGFSHRIPFASFIRRFQFLAFDFDEKVEMTKDDCRLLLVRLKLEGWVIGKSKVFLKYYNEEFLSHLYETQVKKIIKVQSMMRAFLAKRNVASKLLRFRQDSEIKICKQTSVEIKDMDPEEAVVKIQKAYRGYRVRKEYGPLLDSKNVKLDEETLNFVKGFANRWRSKSIFQVLLQYRAARYQDLVSLSQMIHIFNQKLVADNIKTSNCISLSKIDPNDRDPTKIPYRPSVWKLKFSWDDVPFFDTTYLCDPTQNITDNYNACLYDSDQESWDAPLRRKVTLSEKIVTSKSCLRNRISSFESEGDEEDDTNMVHEPFCRDPSIVLKRKAPAPPKYNDAIKNQENISNVLRDSVYSPIPYNRLSVESIRDKFNDDNVVINNKSAVYKKRSAPKAPTPTNSFRNDKEKVVLKKRVAPKPYADNQQSECDTSTLEKKYVSDKINPIKEMELIAKKNSDLMNSEDDPPFNFQGMLRKTQYNRASMKRVQENKLSFSISEDSSKNNNCNYDKENISNNLDDDYPRSPTPLNDEYIETSPVYTNVVYHSKVQNRPKSSQSVIENEEERNGNDIKNENEIGSYIKEELLPGIIIEGYLAHL